MVKVRVANPGPAALMVINPRRKKPMATKRRRSTKRRTTRRRTSTVAANPVHRRRRRSTTRRRTVHASTGHHRRRNPARRRRVSRRNPVTGTIARAIPLAASIAGLGLLQGFIPPIGGSSPIISAVRQAATGYLAGTAMSRFGIMSKYAEDVKLAGVALGVGTLINAYVLPTVSGFLRPAAPAARPAARAGMGDIITMPRGSYDSYYGSTPSFNTNPGSGMNDIVTLPRRQYAY